MISLYPSHIHISFPCPYISHIHKSFIIFAGCPATCVFFIFHFCGMKTGCVFLVIFWCWCCGWFSLRPSSRFSSRFSFRFSVRSSSRPSFRSSTRHAFRFAPRPVFSVSFFAPPFAQPIVSFVRLGVSGGRFVGTRRFVLLVWGWRAFVFFFVSWCRGGNRGGRAVSLMGSVLRMSCRGRLCVMRAMPCGGAWGVLLGEALGGAWWRLWDMGITRRMAGRWGREG